MRKILIALTAVLGSGLALGHAGETESLKAYAPELSAINISNSQFEGSVVPAPAPALTAATPLPSGAQAGEDPVLNALTDAQWNNILNSQPWEDVVAAEDSANKELFGNYHTRYIAKGKVSFATNPPTFTTETGKVFVVVKYPKWLREVGDTKICVEGYAKQRDDTREFVIKKMLAPSAFDDIAPDANMQDLQRSPYIISHNTAGYQLGNVNWNLAHSAAGERLRDQYGNFVSEWQNGVTVNYDMLETAYFVKKSALKPIKYGDHGYLIFTFKPGGVVSADGQQSRALVVSLDAYYKDQANMSYSPVTALKNLYLVYYSIQTVERYFEFKMSKEPQTMTLYPIIITRAQQLQLLDNSIKKAVDNNQGEMYSLFYNSCANSAMSLINSVLEPNRKVKTGWLPEIAYRLKTTLPDSIAKLLMRKGIIGKPLPEVTVANYQNSYSGF